MTQLDVITGFLGAGKTTFLARYAHWLERRGVSFCIIENEFGRAGVDSAILQKTGARVKEISGGCVCCTLKVTLHDLLLELDGKVNRILLEPSGLFCGDDLMDILNSPDCTVQPGAWIGIVDPVSMPMMNGEDLAVLQSELMQAGSVVISKAQLASDEEVCAAEENVKRLLPEPLPKCFAEPWDALCDDEWFTEIQAAGTVDRPHWRRVFDHQSMFQSATLSPKGCYSEAELHRCMERLLNENSGSVLRVKGTLCADDESMWQVNAVPPDCVWTERVLDASRPALNIIGRNLDRARLKTLLEEAQITNG